MLTDEDVEEFNSQCGFNLDNLTALEWRDLTVKLPPGPKELLFFYRFLVTADNWRRRSTTSREPRKPLTAGIRDREKLIKDLSSVVERRRELRSHADGLIAEDIMAMNTVVRHLEGELAQLRFRLSNFGLYKFHRREFVASMLNIWQEAGGKPRFSRNPQPTGPLIRYLEFVWKILRRRERVPAPETLAALISQYKKERRGLGARHGMAE